MLPRGLMLSLSIVLAAASCHGLKGLGFGGLRGLGFRGLGFRGLKFRGLGFRGGYFGRLGVLILGLWKCCHETSTTIYIIGCSASGCTGSAMFYTRGWGSQAGGVGILFLG